MVLERQLKLWLGLSLGIFLLHAGPRKKFANGEIFLAYFERGLNGSDATYDAQAAQAVWTKSLRSCFYMAAGKNRSAVRYTATWNGTRWEGGSCEIFVDPDIRTSLLNASGPLGSKPRGSPIVHLLKRRVEIHQEATSTPTTAAPVVGPSRTWRVISSSELAFGNLRTTSMQCPLTRAGNATYASILVGGRTNKTDYPRAYLEYKCLDFQTAVRLNGTVVTNASTANSSNHQGNANNVVTCPTNHVATGFVEGGALAGVPTLLSCNALLTPAVVNYTACYDVTSITVDPGMSLAETSPWGYECGNVTHVYGMTRMQANATQTGKGIISFTCCLLVLPRDLILG